MGASQTLLSQIPGAQGVVRGACRPQPARLAFVAPSGTHVDHPHGLGASRALAAGPRADLRLRRGGAPGWLVGPPPWPCLPTPGHMFSGRRGADDCVVGRPGWLGGRQREGDVWLPPRRNPCRAGQRDGARHDGVPDHLGGGGAVELAAPRARPRRSGRGRGGSGGQPDRRADPPPLGVRPPEHPRRRTCT